jgi:hypothetical protein
MNQDEFWRLIDEARAAPARKPGPASLRAAENLRALLVKLPAEEVDSFNDHFEQSMQAVYRGDVWDVATIVLQGCGKISFEEFLGWLIIQGRAAYESVAAAPATVGQYALLTEDALCARILTVPKEAYHAVSGSWDVPALRKHPPRAVKGEPLPKAQLPERFPELWKKYRLN